MAYGSAINVVEELGILLRKPDHIGGAVIGFKDAAAWELSADFNVTQSIALRAGYQISSLDFGTDSTQLGTALYHMPKIGLLYTHQERRGRLEGGLLAGPNYYTGIRKSQAATDTFGIQDITPGTTGYHIGPVVDLQWNLKRTGILLGCGFFLPLSLSKAAVMRIETSPDSAFESGDARFGPIVLSVTVGYQFP
jgi:hypothetical protein